MAESLILASASPRRSSLLGSLGVSFVVKPVDIDETALLGGGHDVGASVAHIAEAKFAAFGSQDRSPATTDGRLLTADTLVSCDGHIMGKPRDDDHARDMLEFMSGRSLAIATALCLGEPGALPTTRTVTTIVGLRDLTATEISAYLATGQVLDKAGGLGLQAEARGFVDHVDGCWSNVLGLPVCAVAAAMDLEPAGVERGDRCTTELCGQWTAPAS